MKHLLSTVPAIVLAAALAACSASTKSPNAKTGSKSATKPSAAAAATSSPAAPGSATTSVQTSDPGKPPKPGETPPAGTPATTSESGAPAKGWKLAATCIPTEDLCREAKICPKTQPCTPAGDLARAGKFIYQSTEAPHVHMAAFDSMTLVERLQNKETEAGGLRYEGVILLGYSEPMKAVGGILKRQSSPAPIELKNPDVKDAQADLIARKSNKEIPAKTAAKVERMGVPPERPQGEATTVRFAFRMEPAAWASIKQDPNSTLLRIRIAHDGGSTAITLPVSDLLGDCRCDKQPRSAPLQSSLAADWYDEHDWRDPYWLDYYLWDPAAIDD